MPDADPAQEIYKMSPKNLVIPENKLLNTTGISEGLRILLD